MEKCLHIKQKTIFKKNTLKLLKIEFKSIHIIKKNQKQKINK